MVRVRRDRLLSGGVLDSSSAVVGLVAAGFQCCGSAGVGVWAGRRVRWRSDVMLRCREFVGLTAGRI